MHINAEAVVRRCSVKKVFLKFLQKSQENTCVRVSFLIRLQAQVLIKFYLYNKGLRLIKSDKCILANNIIISKAKRQSKRQRYQNSFHLGFRVLRQNPFKVSDSW